MTHDDALKKIKKCLALARSAEPHEAAAAMRQAQKLMTEFRITDRDMSLIDVAEACVRANSTAVNVWESYLANTVARAFGCELFTRKKAAFNAAGSFTGKRYYVFVGIDGAADVAAYAFEVLLRQCVKSRLAHIAKQPKNCKAITKTARGDEFAKGWVVGVERLVDRFASPARNDALLLEYMAARHPGLKDVDARDTTTGRKLGEGHRSAGFHAGANAVLNRGVDGMAERKLLR